MPFTLSHPAAVLPFLRTPLPASALVAGSLAPDLPSYLPVDVGLPTHTAVAVVTVDVAIGVLLWALWHGLVALPAVDVAPAGLRARLADRVHLGLRRRLAAGEVLVVLVAVLVGAATHVGWDEFTHAGRFGTEHVPALAQRWAGWPGHRWAQELSGLVGAAVLVGWLARWWRRTTPSPVDGAGTWWPVLVVGAATVLGAVTAAAGAPDLRSAAVAAAFRGGSCALAAVIVLSLGWHVRRRAT